MFQLSLSKMWSASMNEVLSLACWLLEAFGGWHSVCPTPAVLCRLQLDALQPFLPQAGPSAPVGNGGACSAVQFCGGCLDMGFLV